MTDSKIDALALSIRDPHLVPEDSVPENSNLRLFSTGGSSELVEWNLNSGVILVTVSIFSRKISINIKHIYFVIM